MTPDPRPPRPAAGHEFDAVLAAFEKRRPVDALKLLLSLRAQGLARPPAPPPTPTGKANAPRPPTPPRATPHRGGLSPGEVPRAQTSVWGWVVVALLAYLGWRLLRG